MNKTSILICACMALLFAACTKELHYTPIEDGTVVINGEASVTLMEAGTLERQFESIADFMSLTKLTVSGPINGTDLKLIREMAGADSVGEETRGLLTVLDLSKAQFVKGGSNPFVYKGTPCPMNADNAIPRYGFGYCKLKEIRLPESITRFDNQAFFHCDSLESVNIPSSLQEMYNSVFCYCGKLRVPMTIPQAVTEINDFTFYECVSIPKITLHDKVKYIGESAFNNCRLITDLGSSLSELDSIAPSAFYQCKKLQKLYLPQKMSTVPAYAYAYCYAIKDIDLTGKTIIDDYAFYACHGLTSLSLPAGLKVIGAYAFGNSNVGGAISIPNTVREVGYGAFYYTKITSVEINSDIELGTRPNLTLPKESFESCSKLKTLKVAEGVTILRLPFSNCKALTSVQLPSTLKSLGNEQNIMDVSSPNGIFANCNALESVSLPDGLEVIGYRAFRGCSGMKSVVIPTSTRKIDAQAFYGCEALTSFTIPKQVSEIGAYVLTGCTNLTNVCVDMNMEEIPQGFLKDCTQLTSFTIPAAVREIGYESFKNSGLTSVTVPEGVTKINNMAFMNCTSLKKVELPSSIESLGPDAFSVCINLCDVCFANDCRLTIIGSSCFYQCTSLSNLVLPPSMMTIGRNAFDTSGLNSVTIPASIITIGDECFANCRRLQTVTNLASQPQSITASVFSGVALQQTTLCVPTTAENAYRNANVWNRFGLITPI